MGRVIDARTTKGIKASVRYSSLPTGTITGRFNDSTFSFAIFGTARYQVVVEANGYNARTVILDPKDIDANKRLTRDILLTPTGETMILHHLIFAQGKSIIDPASFKELDEIALMMSENAGVVIQLEGHTDNVGTPSANIELSEDRVKAVKGYLVKKGISKKRIKTKAFGGSHPLSADIKQDGRSLNRRVEMRILKN
jgi:outer membrane protein OmpA-like peptidoglycan-associated protein